jgi:MFS family permease
MRRWFVLAGCCIGMAVAPPAILLTPLGLFLKSMTAEFGWSRTEFSVIFSALALFNAISMPIAGYLVDRFEVTRIIAIGTVFGCVSYAALSLAKSFGSLIAIMALAMMLGNLASYLSFMGVAQRWFDKRLGFALAVTSSGLAVGTAVFSYLIAKTIERHGWRTAFLTVGVTAVVIGLANLVLLVRDNKGPVPEAERLDHSIQFDASSASLGGALRTRDFWLYAASFSCVIFAVVGCSSHLPALLSDHGASAAQIGSVVAIGAAGSLFGRFFSGIMLDRFSVRGVAGVFFLGQVIGFLLLLDGVRWALPAGFLLGAVQGAEIDLLGYVVARRFGRPAYARIFGSCFAITLVGAMLGPIVMGAIFDRTHSYDLGLMAFPVFPVLAFGLLGLARFSPREIEPAALHRIAG